MKKRVQKIIAVVVMALFGFAAVFCCCGTRQAQAAQTQTMTGMPSCHHAKAASSSMQQQPDCEFCFKHKNFLADLNLKTVLLTSHDYVSIILASLVSGAFDLIKSEPATYASVSPPDNPASIPLYLLHANFRI